MSREIDNACSGLEILSEMMRKAYEKKQESIQKRRKASQNNPITKRRKSEAMKAWHAKKKKDQLRAIEDQKYAEENTYNGCVCHLGNPPCSFCTNSNYCEKCDVKTLESECPECGKEFETGVSIQK